MKKFRNLFFISALLSMIGVSNATVVPTGSMLTQYAGNWESTVNYNFRQVLLNGASLYYTQYSVTRNGNYYIVNNTTIPVIGVAPESSSAWSLVSSSASGGGFVNTIGTINAESGAANGAKIVGNSLYLQYATSTTPGVLSTGAQTIAGAKTFSSPIVGDLTGTASLATNLSGVLQYSIPYQSASGVTSYIGSGFNGAILQTKAGASAPAWTTATYPSTTTINQILYSSAANTIDGLATANNAVLVTNGTGVPSLSTTLPAVDGSNLTNVNASQITTTAIATNATYYPLFVASSSSGNQTVGMQSGLTYNPSTQVLSVPEAIIPELTVNATTGSNLPFQVLTNNPQSTNGYYGMSIEKTDAVMQSGNQLGTLNYRGITNGTTTGTSVRLTGWAAESWTNSTIGSYFTIDTTPKGTTNRTQALRIGNIGGSNINSQFFGSVTATAFLGNATSATTATNIAGGAANQIPYQTGAGATSYVVAPTTAGTYLHWTGSTWEYITPFGWYNYQDTATSGTPIAVTGGVNTELTNNAAGSATSTTYGVTGVSTVWNTGTNRFNFTSLNPGDFVNLRVTVVVTTTAANQEVTLKFNGGIGGTPFTLNIADVQFKTAGAHQISADTMVAMYNTNTTNNPASISILSDDNCTVVVNSFLASVNKR